MMFFNKYVFITLALLLPCQYVSAIEGGNAPDGASFRSGSMILPVILFAAAGAGLGLIISGGVTIGVVREPACNGDGSLACCDPRNTSETACNIGSGPCEGNTMQRCVIYGSNSTTSVYTKAKPWALGYGITAILVGSFIEIVTLAIIGNLNGKC